MCLRPITRKVSSHGIYKTVTHSCGTCLECVSQLQNDWANRLSDEFKNWRFAYFATLTYSNPRLPFVDIVPSELPGDMQDFLSYAIDKIPFSSALSKARARSDKYVEYLKPSCIRENLSVKVPLVSKYDIQCFLKRLRVNFSRKFGHEFVFKYFLCSEYGPCTLRPHYHIIIFSDECLERVSSMVEQSYQLGAVRGFHQLKVRNGSISDACAYCAKYCCKPSEFENPFVVAGLIPRPFRLMSKGIGAAERSSLVSLVNSYKYHTRGDYHGFDKKFLTWFDQQLHRLSYGKDGQVFRVKQPRYYADACFPQIDYYSNVYDAKKCSYFVRKTRRKNCESLLSVAYSAFLEDRYIQLCEDKFRQVQMSYPHKTFDEIVHICECDRLQNLRERQSKKLQSFVRFYGKSFLNGM